MTELMQAGLEFARVLEEARNRANADFEWYRYNSLSNLETIAGMLGEEQLVLAREKGVLDVGCGDGDLAFFFERLGCEVVAIDHPGPNHNGMRGVRRLKEVLGSRVEIREVDLDSQFAAPDRRFGLTLFLGALYHVKNPFYILETLAKCSEYCVMSTRIARRFPVMGRIPEGAAVAYLLDPDELNADESNYWIFSEAGLQKILKRARWRICAYRSVGDTADSDATSLNHDERAYCLLRSEWGLANVALVAGWNDAEPGGWRWTERRFSIRALAEGAAPSRVTLNVYVPPEAVVRPLKLSMRARGKALAPAVFERPGLETIVRQVEPGELIEFELDRALAPDEQDPRERGIIVGSIRFD
jgi:tRNA (mo5U34)-methyltransferase